MSTRWQPDAPALPEQVDCITRLLGDRVLTGKYAGHTVCPSGLTQLTANRAISDLQRMAYPDNGCRGGVCRSILEQCSRHSSEYQSRYGRAANE